MRANRFTEIDDVNRAAGSNIDHLHGAAIGAGFAHAGISVDGDVSEFAVGRRDDFVAVDIDADGGDGLARIGVDDQQRVIALIGDQKILRGKQRRKKDYTG